MSANIPESELILNPDGSIYHLKLHPEQIADTIIVVGDQGRVPVVSKYFDSIEHQVQNREIVTHTGRIGDKRITALSTGMGTDNIDIVLNELDALVNIDLGNRTVKEKHHSLDIIRIGTSGSLQADIPVDSFLLSTHGIGFDGLLNFYKAEYTEEEIELTEAFCEHINWNGKIAKPYVIEGSQELINSLSEGMHLGMTATAPGFYGPQGRQLRLSPAIENLNELLTDFNHNGKRVTNFEMETSALYGLGRALGHRTATCCLIIANRLAKTYSKDYKKTMEKLIQDVLGKIA